MPAGARPPRDDRRERGRPSDDPARAASEASTSDASRSTPSDASPTSPPLAERFPRETRILRGNHFGEVFRHGRRSSSAALRLVLNPNDRGYARLGLAVSRGVSKRAVVRNRVKRRLREIFRRNRDRIPPSLDIVAIPQPSILEYDFDRMRDEFLALIDAYWSRAQRYGHGDPASEPRRGRRSAKKAAKKKAASKKSAKRDGGPRRGRGVRKSSAADPKKPDAAPGANRREADRDGSD